jgi:hypothetical protein
VDPGYSASLGSLGAVVGVGTAIVTTGSDTRKVYQIAGLTAAGVGAGMAIDPQNSGGEQLAGSVLAAIGLASAIFGGN